jgi:hypothetical protein
MPNGGRWSFGSRSASTRAWSGFRGGCSNGCCRNGPHRAGVEAYYLQRISHLHRRGAEGARCRKLKGCRPGEVCGGRDIDPVYFDSPYFVYPDGPIAVEVLRVIGAAMAKAGVVGLGRLTLSRRERMVMVEADLAERGHCDNLQRR